MENLVLHIKVRKLTVFAVLLLRETVGPKREGLAEEGEKGKMNILIIYALHRI
jgi:hypothetical protein